MLGSPVVSCTLEGGACTRGLFLGGACGWGWGGLPNLALPLPLPSALTAGRLWPARLPLLLVLAAALDAALAWVSEWWVCAGNGLMGRAGGERPEGAADCAACVHTHV